MGGWASFETPELKSLWSLLVRVQTSIPAVSTDNNLCTVIMQVEFVEFVSTDIYCNLLQMKVLQHLCLFELRQLWVEVVLYPRHCAGEHEASHQQNGENNVR